MASAHRLFFLRWKDGLLVLHSFSEGYHRRFWHWCWNKDNDKISQTPLNPHMGYQRDHIYIPEMANNVSRQLVWPYKRQLSIWCSMWPYGSHDKLFIRKHENKSRNNLPSNIIVVFGFVNKFHFGVNASP